MAKKENTQQAAVNQTITEQQENEIKTFNQVTDLSDIVVKALGENNYTIKKINDENPNIVSIEGYFTRTGKNFGISVIKRDTLEEIPHNRDLNEEIVYVLKDIRQKFNWTYEKMISFLDDKVFNSETRFKNIMKSNTYIHADELLELSRVFGFSLDKMAHGEAQKSIEDYTTEQLLFKQAEIANELQRRFLTSKR